MLIYERFCFLIFFLILHHHDIMRFLDGRISMAVSNPNTFFTRKGRGIMKGGGIFPIKM